jgi:hypothetical protein
MRRLQHPLDPKAVAAANKALQSETGGRTLTMDDDDAELRKKWVDAYLAAGGQEKTSNRRPVKSAKQPCPKTTWVELQYCYVNGKGVPGASYSVSTPDAELLASGKLDQNGFVHVSGLPDGLSDINYSFNNDPPYTIFPEFQPVPNPYPVPDPNYIVEAGESGKLSAVLHWVWGTIEGDFNDDPTLGQIAAGTVITLIPVVDQIGDVRDLVANLKKLIIDERYDEFFVWLGVIVTVIGCFPEVGSAIKGVLKAVQLEGIKLFRIVKKLNFVGEGHAIRWLRELLKDLPKHGAKAAKKIAEIFEHLAAKLRRVQAYATAAAARQLDRILDAIAHARARIGKMVDRAVEYFSERLNKLLGEAEDVEKAGATETKNLLKQESEPMRSGAAHGAEREAERELKELALGLSDKKKGLDYRKWAEENGWSTYGNLSGGGTFPKQIDEAMTNADKIHFNLDGVDVNRASGKLNEFGEPFTGNYTNYELYMLKTKPEFAAKVTWWKDGVPMPKGWSPF